MAQPHSGILAIFTTASSNRLSVQSSDRRGMEASENSGSNNSSNNSSTHSVPGCLGEPSWCPF